MKKILWFVLCLTATCSFVGCNGCYNVVIRDEDKALNAQTPISNLLTVIDTYETWSSHDRQIFKREIANRLSSGGFNHDIFVVDMLVLNQKEVLEKLLEGKNFSHVLMLEQTSESREANEKRMLGPVSFSVSLTDNVTGHVVWKMDAEVAYKLSSMGGGKHAYMAKNLAAAIARKMKAQGLLSS